jgi:hypothetical protein
MDQLFALGNVSNRKAILEIAPCDAGHDPPEANSGVGTKCVPGLRGAGHRARIRATRWLAMTIASTVPLDVGWFRQLAGWNNGSTFRRFTEPVGVIRCAIAPYGPQKTSIKRLAVRSQRSLEGVKPNLVSID